MDFNQILLFASLGVLAVVLLFALLGFLVGLKRELKCTAVFIVLLVLFWLVLGDAATFLNSEALGSVVANLLEVKGDSINTLWDVIVAYAKDYIPNGEALLVEGKETYALFHSIVSAVFHFVGLLAGTIIVLVITPIIRIITGLIGIIYRSIKRGSARRKAKRAARAAKNGSAEAEVVATEVAEEQIVIPSSESSAEEAVITKEATELPVKKAGKKRLWGALTGALKGAFIVMILCAPLSGVMSILNTASPKTQALLSNVMNGEMQNVGQSDDVVETVFDIAEAYNDSALGKFIEAPGFFFGDSFSEKMFDNMFKVETKNQSFYLTDEIKTVIETVNALNGKIEVGTWTTTEVTNALNELKDSKLIVEVMPTIIEVAYEFEEVQAILDDAEQGDAFLDLRYNNWKNDISLILDFVAEVYALDLFPVEEIDPLDLDVEQIRTALDTLTDTEIINEGLDIALAIAFSLEDVKTLIGEIDYKSVDVDWKQEFNSLVDIYAYAQDILADVENLEFNEDSIKGILTNSAKIDSAFAAVKEVLSLQLVEEFGMDIAFGFIENSIAIEDETLLNAILSLEQYAQISDFKVYVDGIRILVDLIDFSTYPEITFDPFKLDVDILRQYVDKMYSTDLTVAALNTMVNWALSLENVQTLTNGVLADLQAESIDWKGDALLGLDTYELFLSLGFESVEDFKDPVAIVENILATPEKVDTIVAILSKSVEVSTFKLLSIPVVQSYIDKFIAENYAAFNDILDLNDLTVEQWQEDFRTLMDMAVSVSELNVFEYVETSDLASLDIVSPVAIENIKNVIKGIFDLNILGTDEMKTKALLASIEQFEWTILPEDFDASSIVWDAERDVLCELVDVYAGIAGLPEVDIYNLDKVDLVAVLENDDFFTYVVDALEALIDSNVVMELLPGLLDKYVLPMTEGLIETDDETLFNDLLHTLSSEEIVNEIIKLIDVVKAAIDMNLLHASEGVDKIDIANTDAIKTIISGIFDSKFLKGHEGRIIRVLLKATGLLDINKISYEYAMLVHLDYTGEKEVLLAIVDTLAPVLKDPEFTIFKNGSLNLDLDFWLQNEKARIVLDAVSMITGSYEDDSIVGSKLLEILLPVVYDQYVEGTDLVPSEFAEVLEILNVTDASGEMLMNDLSCLVYILDQCVTLGLQSLAGKNPGFDIASNNSITAINNIVDALHAMELFHGNEAAFLSWALNFAADKAGVEIETSPEDFANVNWQSQKDFYKEIISDLGAFLQNNNLYNGQDFKDFINNKTYNTKEFISQENASDLLVILDKLVDVQIFDAVSPLIVKYALSKVEIKGLSLDYVLEFTNSQINDDLHSIISILKTAVNDIDIVNLYHNDFNGDFALPKADDIANIVSTLFDLHLINEEDGAVTTYVLEKVLGGNAVQIDSLVIEIADLGLVDLDWKVEKEVFVNLVYNAFDLLSVNNINTVAELRTAISDQWYLYPTFFRDETGYVLADVVRTLAGSQLIENVIGKVWDYALEELNKVAPFEVDYMSFIDASLIMDDFLTVADIIDLAVEFGAFEYLRSGDIAYMDLEYVAQIIEKLPTLNIIDNSAQRLIYDLYQLANKYVKQALPVELNIVLYCDLADEFGVIADAIREAQALVDAAKLSSLSSVLDAVKEKSYTEKSFYNKEVYVAAIDVVKVLVNLNYVEQIAKPVAEYGLDVLADKGIAFDFVNFEEYNAKAIVKDIKVVLEMAKYGYDLGVVEYAFDKNISTLDITPVAGILEEMKALTILELYAADFANYGLDAIRTKTGFNPEISYEELVALFDYKVELTNLQDVVVELQDVIVALNITSLSSALDKVESVKAKLNRSVKSLLESELSEALAYEALDVVTELLDLQLVELVADTAVVKFVEFADSKNINISYLTNEEYENALVVADAKTLVEVARKVVEAGAVEYIKKANIAQVEFEPVHDIIDLVASTNAVNLYFTELVTLAVNCISNVVKSDIKYDVEDFANVELAAEVEVLHNVISAVDTFLYDNNIFSVNDILDFAKNQEFNKADFFTVSNGQRIEAIIVAAASSQTLEVVLPDLLNVAVAVLKQVDLSFLTDLLTGSEIAEDIKTIAHLIPLVIKTGAVKVVYGADVKDLVIDTETYQAIIATLKDVNMLNAAWADFASLGANTLYNVLKAPYSVTAADFADADFATDMDHLIAALGEIGKLLENVEARKVNDVLSLVNELTSEKVLNTKNAYVVLNVLEEITSMETVKALYPTLAGVAKDKLAGLPVNVAYLLDGATKEELVEDVASIINALNKLVAFGAIDIAFYDGYIGTDNFSAIYTALEEILLLNVLDGNHTTLILDVLKALGVEIVDFQLTANLNAIDWSEEVDSLIAVLEAVRKALVFTDINKVSAFSSFDVNSLLVIDENTNELLDIVAEFLNALGNDKLVMAVSLPAAKKFMPSLDAKFTNIADVHNIYFHTSDFASDLVSLSEVVSAIKALDINAVLNKGAVLPYDNFEAIETIIKNVLGLNYLQNTAANPNRVSQIIAAVDQFVSLDLSKVDGTNVDLAQDAEYIYAAYEYFYNIVCHENWPVQYFEDINSINLPKEMLTDYHLYQDVLNILVNIMDTTIYTEIVPAVAVTLLPQYKDKFVEIYDILDLDNYTVAEAKNDFAVLANIIDAVNSVNIVNTIELEIYFTASINEAVVAILNNIEELQVIKGHGAELINYFADQYVNNKIFGDVVMVAGTVDASDIDFHADKENLIAIINSFFKIAYRIDVENFNQLISYVKGLNSFEDAKATLGDQKIVDALETILNSIADLTVLQGNGYRVAKAVLPAVLKGNAFADLLANVSKEEFVEDLYTIAGLLTIADEFGLVAIINDELINYDQADLFKDFFVGLFGLNILNANLENLVDYAANLGLPVSIDALKDANLEKDAYHIAAAYEALLPFLTSSENPFDRLSVFQALTEAGFELEIGESAIYNNLYPIVEAYEELTQMTIVNLMLPVVAEKAVSSTSGTVKEVLDILNVTGLTSEQYAEDLAQTAVILRTLVDLGLEDFFKFGNISLSGKAVSTLNGEEVVMTKAEMVTLIVDALHAMNITTYSAVLEGFDKLGVDTFAMNLHDLDFDSEIELLNEVIVNLINVFIELGYEDILAIKDYVMNINPSNIKEELKVVYADADLVHFVNIFNAIDESQFVLEVLQPLYNKYIYPSFSSDLQAVANLDSYTKDLLDEDLHALAVIANELYLMDSIDAPMNDKFTHPEVVKGTEVIIEALFNLNILDIKLQPIVEYLDTKLAIDLSGLDLSNVDLSKDGETLQAVAYQMLSVAECLRVDGIYLSHLGNTELVIKAFDVLKAVFDTELFVEISNWAVQEYVAPKATNLKFSRDIVANLVHELEETIDALICMGFFSNGEVDFTNKANTDRLFGLIENVFEPSKLLKTQVNKLKSRIHLVGKVDINYAELNNDTEINAFKEAARSVLTLMPNIKNIESLLDPQVQADIITVFEQLFVSELAKQLVLPIANGVVKVYTADYYMLSLLEGVDYVEFTNIFLPDAYQLLEKANNINAFSGSIDFKNTDAVIELFRVLVFAESFAPHTGDIVKFMFAYKHIDVKSKDFSEVNWEDEFYSVEAALHTMHDEIQGLDTSDKGTYLNPEFVSALADALPEFDNSKLLPQILREVVSHMVNKTNPERAAVYTDRLFEESYDNEALMNDYRLLDNILDEVVATGFLEGAATKEDTIDYGEQGVAAINNLLKLFFELEYRKGMEATLFSFVQRRVDLIKDYEFDYEAVTDWEEEKTPLLAAGDQVVELAKVCPVNQINHDTLRDTAVQDAFVKVVEAMSKSIMGRQFVPQIYEREMEPNLGSEDYNGILDFSDPGFTADIWADEFEKLFNVYNKLEDYQFASGDMHLSLAESKQLMVDLFGPSIDRKSEGVYAVANNPQKWLARLFKSDIVTLPNGAVYNRDANDNIVMFEDSAATPVVCEWANEPYALINLMDAMIAIDNNNTFDYNNVYECADAAKLEALLNAIIASGILRGTAFQVLVNTLDSNPELKEAIYWGTDLLSAEFYDYETAYNNNSGYYNSTYWTPEIVNAWATAIATYNQLP